MEYAIERLCGAEVLLAKVHEHELVGPSAERLRAELQTRFRRPVMLIFQPGPTWANAQASADFNCNSHFEALKDCEEIEWNELHAKPEPDLPF